MSTKGFSSKITIISFSPIYRDARVLRQVEYLSKYFSITVLGYGGLNSSSHDPVQMFSLRLPSGLALMRKARTLILLPLGRILPGLAYDSWYWGRVEHRAALEIMLKNEKCAIHANEWESLPVAVKASENTGARVVLDLHEYSPLEMENQWIWRIFYKPMIDYFLNKYVSRVSASVTVNKSIAEKYAKNYGFRPDVVMNAPVCTDAPSFKATDPKNILLVHHGGAMRDRRLELMIRMMVYTDTRYSLHLILIESSRGYVSEIKALAEDLVPGRVFFHQPVRPQEIISRLSEFDMGIFLLPFTNFNYTVALPNKFFDFIGAGLAVCVGPSPEMAQLTRQFGFGVVSESFDPFEVAGILNGLSAADIDGMKMQALKARNVLNADVEMGKLLSLYARLLEEA
jgi:hypothetical protein